MGNAGLRLARGCWGPPGAAREAAGVRVGAAPLPFASRAGRVFPARLPLPCTRVHARMCARMRLCPPTPRGVPAPGSCCPSHRWLSQCPQSSSPLLLGTGRAPAATAGSCLCWQRDGPARHGTARPTPQGGCACPGTGGSRCHTAAQSCCWNRGESSSVGSHTRVQSLPCAGTRVVCLGHAHAVRAGHRCRLHGSAAPHMPHCMSEPCGAEGT